MEQNVWNLLPFGLYLERSERSGVCVWCRQPAAGADQHDHEATAMIKAQFMQLWDGLATDNHSTVLVMGATNRPKDVDKAILRYCVICAV